MWNYFKIPVDFSDENDNQTAKDAKKKSFFYKSIVYPKQDKPKWNEVLNVSIPHGKKVEEIKKTYLRFLIRNRSLDGKLKIQEDTAISARLKIQVARNKIKYIYFILQKFFLDVER